MYIWNVFVAMKNVSHLFGPMLDRVERELFDHKHDKSKKHSIDILYFVLIINLSIKFQSLILPLKAFAFLNI